METPEMCSLTEQHGPGIGNNSAGGVYKSAAVAAEDIKEFGFPALTYRVKWRPSKA
jgi:hypothetical protein